MDGTVAELLQSAAEVAPATRASYERRWRMWQAFADHHGVPALPADRDHVAAFVVARHGAGLSREGLAANLSAVLYWGCFRGEELASTRRHQLRFVDQGIEWSLPRAKNDQHGQGHMRGVPRSPDPWICPVTALTDWIGRLERFQGRPLRPDDPVFPALNRTGAYTTPISRESISDTVKHTATRAGLTGDYGSHSPEPASPPTPSTTAYPANNSRPTAAGATTRVSTPTTAAPRSGAPPTLPTASPASKTEARAIALTTIRTDDVFAYC